MITTIEIDEQYQISKDDIQNISTSHLIFTTPSIHIDTIQMNAVQLHDDHIFTDYLIKSTYQNQWGIFGKPIVNTTQLLVPNLQPAMIFHKEMLLRLLSDNVKLNYFDLMLHVLLKQKTIHIDGHMVFNFLNPLKPTKTFLNQFGPQLQQFGRYYGYLIEKLDSDQSSLLFIDRYMQQRLINKCITTLKLYPAIYRWLLKRKLKPYQHYQKHPIFNKTEQMVVFLGFDFTYRGNSKYLFETMITMLDTPIYFVLKDDDPLFNNHKNANHFVPLSQSKSLIEKAKVVILESFAPDHYKMNGIVINLWHGTPIKQLFLDSLEPYQNEHIFLYKLRKYNKMKRTNYFLTDHETANHLFQSAFHINESKIIPYGYPRVHYLKKNRLTNKQYLFRQMIEKYQLDPQKPILVYLPTWRDYDYIPLDFEQISQKMNILSKPHPESTQSINGIIVDEPTEDLLAIADIVLSDYSSVVFDSLSLNIPTYLVMDDIAQYVKTRGVYSEVLKDLSPIIFYNRQDLIETLSHQPLLLHQSKFINQTTHDQQLIQHIKNCLDQ